MRSLICLLFLLVSPKVFAFDHSEITEAFRHELVSHDTAAMAARADLALDNMIQASIVKLREHGHDSEADRIQREWLPMRGSIHAIVTAERETPEDYAPLSAWLADWYHTMKDSLGAPLCTLFHFDDVQVMNWGTPTVFRMAVIGSAMPDATRYELYFDPWCGVVSYWTVYGICMAAGGAMVCGPAAMTAEELMVRVIAPRFSDTIWAYVYGQ